MTRLEQIETRLDTIALAIEESAWDDRALPIALEEIRLLRREIPLLRGDAEKNGIAMALILPNS
jgi:hypothetical protein